MLDDVIPPPVIPGGCLRAPQPAPSACGPHALLENIRSREDLGGVWTIEE